MALLFIIAAFFGGTFFGAACIGLCAAARGNIEENPFSAPRRLTPRTSHPVHEQPQPDGGENDDSPRPVFAVTVNGRNWGEIFSLPIVTSVNKPHPDDPSRRPFTTIGCGTCLFFDEYCPGTHMSPECYKAYPGDRIVKYSNGRWGVEKPIRHG